METTIIYKPIGYVHSPVKERKGAPIQSSVASDIRGCIELSPEYEEGLLDLDGFSHIIVLYHFHLSEGCELQPVPFADDKPHGVFAVRAPKRPNPIGLSILHLDKIDGVTLYVSGLDILDGTPVLDIKPYVEAFDHRPGARSGWLEKQLATGDYRKKADERFL